MKIEERAGDLDSSCLISVIVPIYNVQDFLKKCVDSIIRQTYSNIEIILVDDGSTDECPAICDAYVQLDARIRVVHKSNGGLVSARQAGLEIAQGSCIGFVDGDDWIEPSMYEKLLKILQESNADFVHTGYFENGIKIIPYIQRVLDLSSNKEELLADAVLGPDWYVSPSIWSKLFQKDLILKSYGKVPNNSSYGEDLINLVACILECNGKAVLLEEAYYHYRIRDGSLSRKRDATVLMDIVHLYGDICDILRAYGYYEALESVMENYLLQELSGGINTFNPPDAQIPRCLFSDMGLLMGKKIAIYGAGPVGRDYYAQICKYSGCRIVVWVDSYPKRYHYPYMEVKGADALCQEEVDCVLIAVRAERTAQEIREKLLAEGVEQEKIIWLPPKYLFKD